MLFPRVRTVLRDQRGYSLVELIGAMMIFSLVMVVAISAFVTISQSSTKTASQRKVQQDARYNFEEVVRMTRSSTIDYAFYKNAPANSGCTIAERRMLALLTTQGDSTGNTKLTRSIYFYDPGANGQSGTLWRYRDNSTSTQPPACNAVLTAPIDTPGGDAGGFRSQISNQDVTIDSFKFFINPNTDPYDVNASVYGRLIHPRVTIVMTGSAQAKGLGVSSKAKSSAITYETSVSTRAYPYAKAIGAP